MGQVTRALLRGSGSCFAAVTFQPSTIISYFQKGFIKQHSKKKKQNKAYKVLLANSIFKQNQLSNYLVKTLLAK